MMWESFREKIEKEKEKSKWDVMAYVIR
jgi:hypothetical protein